jgi:hypothetical protein
VGGVRESSASPDLRRGHPIEGRRSLSVPDAKAAAGGTSQFLLAIGFGPLMKRTTTYTIETRAGKPGSGNGTVTIKDAGATANAETADGVKLTGTIDCKKVTRAQ